jgi:hypothetical protein
MIRKNLQVLAIVAALFLNVNKGGAQGMSVNTTGATASPSAMLDVQSTTQGMLVPRMTTAQMNLISSPATGLLVYNTTVPAFYFYNGSAWISLNSSTTSAGGDLAGTYPNPTIAATAGAGADVVSAINASSSAINSANLAASGVTAGTYGSATQVPSYTVDSKGRITAAGNTTITGTTPGGAAGGDLTGTYPSPALIATGTAGTYGNATQTPVFTTDSKGRVTAVTNTTITGTTPGGAAGGDLTGTYPSPALIATGTAGTYGSATQTPVFTTDSKGRITGVTNTTITASPGGAAGGDLTGTYPNPTLAATGVTAGIYGSATQVPNYTVDSKGRITAAANTTITGTTPGGAAGGDLTGTYPNPTLAATGVTAGIYGSATQVPNYTVDSKGRITAAANTTITGTTPGGAAGGDLTGTYPNPTLAAAGTAGTYGSATQVPVFTTDSKGRVTAVTNTTLSGITGAMIAGTTIAGTNMVNNTVTTTQIGSGVATSGQVLTANGTGGETWATSSGGSVTSVSSGFLAPIFVTSVSNATTTPSISYTLASSGAYTLFGNNTGGITQPTYFTPTLASGLFNDQGTTTTVLHGNASGNPSWGQIQTSDIANSAVTTTQIGSGAATSGQVLTANGTGGESWSSETFTGGDVTGAKPTLNIASTAGPDIVTAVNTGSSVINAANLGSASSTSGYVLTSNGSGPATWMAASAGWGLTGNSGTTPGTNFIGTTDSKALDFKVNSTWAGEINPTTGNSSYGLQAGQSVTSGINNTAMGSSALQSYTTGNFNTAVGASALKSATGSTNTALGSSALFTLTTASDNTAVGSSALAFNVTGASNTAVGRSALQSNTASNNTAVGFQALTNNVSGTNNTATGYSALSANTSGGSNTAMGNSALQNNTASNNTAVGANALNANTAGYQNTATGVSSLQANTTGYGNTATGYSSLQNNTTGISNTAIGTSALLANTTGGGNTAAGTGTLTANTTGAANTAIGGNSLFANTTGSSNVATGSQSLGANTTGGQNTATGVNSLTTNTTGAQNTAAGSSSLLSNTTGGSNAAYGFNSLQNNTTGGANTAIGQGSLQTNTTGSTNTAIGYLADVATAALSNATAIGNGASVAASNTVQLGNSSVTNVNTTGNYTSGTIGSVSGGVTLNGSTSGYTSVKPSATAGSWTMTLPPSTGASGQFLTTDGTGVTSWATPGGGGGSVTLTTTGSSGAATLSGGTLNIPNYTASGTAGGDLTGSYPSPTVATGAITSAKIASATITSGNIASATITGANIASATITGANISSATITGANIASNTVAVSNLSAGGSPSSTTFLRGDNTWAPISAPYRNVTSNFNTLLSTDQNITYEGSASSVIFTLPSAASAGAGHVITIWAEDNYSGGSPLFIINVLPAGSIYKAGNLVPSETPTGYYFVFISDGTNWASAN